MKSCVFARSGVPDRPRPAVRGLRFCVRNFGWIVLAGLLLLASAAGCRSTFPAGWTTNQPPVTRAASWNQQEPAVQREPPSFQEGWSSGFSDGRSGQLPAGVERESAQFEAYIASKRAVAWADWQRGYDRGFAAGLESGQKHAEHNSLFGLPLPNGTHSLVGPPASRRAAVPTADPPLDTRARPSSAASTAAEADPRPLPSGEEVPRSPAAGTAGDRLAAAIRQQTTVPASEIPTSPQDGPEAPDAARVDPTTTPPQPAVVIWEETRLPASSSATSQNEPAQAVANLGAVEPTTLWPGQIAPGQIAPASAGTAPPPSDSHRQADFSVPDHPVISERTVGLRITDGIRGLPLRPRRD
jgi:hypothetical protein